MYLSVIIPAYNEENRITKTLISIDKYLSKQKYGYEILVVNDGSSDNTVAVVEELDRNIKNLKIIDNKKNHGKGWVVKQGMLMAKGEIRLFTDADNSTSIDQFENMIPYFESGYDIVIGSRRVKGAEINIHQPWYKELLGMLGNLWIRVFAAGGIKDTQAGFKAFTSKAADKVFRKMTLDRWGFDFEVLAIAKRKGLKIKEMPIVWVNDEMSHVKMSAYIKTLVEVLKVWKNKITGKYD